MMKVYIEKDYAGMSNRASGIVADCINEASSPVLGLATGSTPIGLYKELVQRYNNGDLDFSGCITFNLDEYLGLPADNHQSYHYFMHEHLFNHVNVNRDNVHIPDGMAASVTLHCEEYEAAIRAQGGIDLQILGIGSNGHIGFNEPGSSFESRTRRVTLSPESVTANARHFSPGEEIPGEAITMGISTIMGSSRILLMANGMQKAEAISRALEGDVSEECPASVLQTHPDVVVVLDDASASLLKNRKN